MKIFVFELKEGMIISKDVFTPTGLMVIPEGSVVTEAVIERMESLGVDWVDIDEPEEPLGFESTASRFNDSISFKRHKKRYESLKDHLNDIFDGLVGGKPDKRAADMLINESYKYFEQNEMGLDLITMLHTMRDHSDATYMHCINVGLIASFIGRWLGWSKEEVKILNACGLFHDIGKLQIPKEIIDKPDKLTEEEEKLMKSHPVLGYNLLTKVGMDKRIANAALMHHERCNGKGYPFFLKGPKIDDYAKIIAIADVYEAMTSNRTYRRPLCPFEAIEQFEINGYENYDTEYLLVFMKNIVNTYLHSDVSLSNGDIAEVIFINNNKKSKPLVITSDGRAVDLIKQPDLKITGIL